MDEALKVLGEHIASRRPDCVANWRVELDQLTIEAAPASIIGLVEFLKSDGTCRFTHLIDITAVDHPERERRFTVVYHFLSMHQNQRVRVRAAVREDESIASLTGLFPNANWYEREVFDMFGVLFTGHPDLRRILTDYGFRGHPLRKDFPTTGYVELRYDDAQKRVVYEPVKLVHDYRQYDYLSPWEGAKYVLPGDEKGEEAK
ncbi:NADH-quinone oxidoreductase subunit C [Tropicimonas isoalkanivorans]|uniref:NADH-quinone oxidoreductase subunit C n=1 Tax=Tropicimonas isoalkanivorans TaxID=441112 RepID=A0A1I1DMD8_9RHOB|nr:NADH-quinone oxidoreductase subunit C [Tropicimonas isoalkanivorans]SFB75994.1 NADH dehydrogenase subunit C [Tropicimonas isoalkanivorans]